MGDPATDMRRIRDQLFGIADYKIEKAIRIWKEELNEPFTVAEQFYQEVRMIRDHLLRDNPMAGMPKPPQEQKPIVVAPAAAAPTARPLCPPEFMTPNPQQQQGSHQYDYGDDEYTDEPF